MKFFASALIIFSTLFLFSGNAFAQPGNNQTNNSNNTQTNNSGNTQTPEPLGQTQVSVEIANPISVDSIPGFIQKVLDFILTIGIPILAMAIIYSGLLFVTARGKEAQITKAKNAFTYAVIGGFILLASWLIAGVIRDALTDIVSMI